MEQWYLRESDAARQLCKWTRPSSWHSPWPIEGYTMPVSRQIPFCTFRTFPRYACRTAGTRELKITEVCISEGRYMRRLL